VLPDTVKEKPQMGKVIAVGDGVMEDGELVKNSMHIKVGQVIVYKKWGGNEVKIGNEEFLLIKQEDVMAVVE
jgi:chaperonin GroES